MFWSEGNEDSDSMFNELVVILAEQRKSAAELLQLHRSLAAPPARPSFREMTPVVAIEPGVLVCASDMDTMDI